MGWNGGFDVVLGNPPWDQTEMKEKEFSANKKTDIANSKTAAITQCSSFYFLTFVKSI